MPLRFLSIVAGSSQALPQHLRSDPRLYSGLQLCRRPCFRLCSDQCDIIVPGLVFSPRRDVFQSKPLKQPRLTDIRELKIPVHRFVPSSFSSWLLESYAPLFLVHKIETNGINVRTGPSPLPALLHALYYTIPNFYLVLTQQYTFPTVANSREYPRFIHSRHRTQVPSEGNEVQRISFRNAAVSQPASEQNQERFFTITETHHITSLDASLWL
jgi:hypothetical protein